MSKSLIRTRAKSIAWILTLVYFASYFMRINFAVMIVKVCQDMNKAEPDLAIVLTMLTISYGLGQIINGFLGDKIKPQYMLSGGLCLAVICNVCMSFAEAVPLMMVVWCVNGYAHSMLWPPIVRLMSGYLTNDEYSYAAVRISWGSSFATITLYLLCPALLMALSWRQIILSCAAVGAVILVVWQIFQARLFDQPLSPVVSSKPSEKTQAPGAKLPRYVLVAIPMIMLGIVLQGSLRDGVTDWMPSILHARFDLPAENAILYTVIPAIFSVFSFMGFDLVHRKLFRNEVTCATVIFVGSAISSLLLAFSDMWFRVPALAILLMALIIACMHGINLMLITVVPKRFLKTGKVSTVSGILNACTYIGASISVYGFAALKEHFGWTFVFFLWFGISLAGAAVCGVISPIWKKFRREYADTPSQADSEDPN